MLLCTLAFAQNQTATKQLTIKVKPAALVISTSALPDATVGQAYSATLQVTGGTAPFSWSVSSGTLPSGLSLTPSSGVISGTPSTAGTSTVSFQVTDSSGTIATIKLQWQPSTSQVVGYNILRGITTGGPYAQVTQTAQLNATDTVPRKSGDTYFYVAEAFNSAGLKSVYSNEAKAVIP